MSNGSSVGYCQESGQIGSLPVYCDKTKDHPGQHHDPTWRLTWPPAARGGWRRFSRPRLNICGVGGCNLHPKHRGPHGDQGTLL